MENTCCWTLADELELCGMITVEEKVMTKRAGYESGPWRNRRNPSSCETADSEARVLKIGVGFVDERGLGSGKTLDSKELIDQTARPSLESYKYFRGSFSGQSRRLETEFQTSVPTEYIVNGITSMGQVVFCQDDPIQAFFRKPSSSVLRSNQLQGQSTPKLFSSSS